MINLFTYLKICGCYILPSFKGFRPRNHIWCWNNSGHFFFFFFSFFFHLFHGFFKFPNSFFHCLILPNYLNQLYFLISYFLVLDILNLQSSLVSLHMLNPAEGLLAHNTEHVDRWSCRLLEEIRGIHRNVL